ncbi:hypothetical protein GCM10010320_42830 [Streptomyces caelestis]|nr:hypothetical protein GCM10010320_42830 [Streptomyces caelestis]
MDGLSGSDRASRPTPCRVSGKRSDARGGGGAAGSVRRGAVGPVRREVVSPKLGKRGRSFEASAPPVAPPPSRAAVSSPDAAEPRTPERARSFETDGVSPVAASEDAARASSGEAGGCEGRGGVLGRGGKEARRASVLMHPPFPRTRAAAYRAGRVVLPEARH